MINIDRKKRVIFTFIKKIKSTAAIKTNTSVVNFNKGNKIPFANWPISIIAFRINLDELFSS